VVYLIFILILVLSIFSIKEHGIFSGKNEITKIIEYKNKNIEENSLVIVDSRTYRGRIALAFNDRHYLESSYLDQLGKSQEQIPGSFVQLKTYFIECITDDCGWGTINDQQDFNSSMENVVSLFKNNSKELEVIKNSYGDDYFRVYETSLTLKESSLQLADSTHDWFYYPVRYEKESFDDYKVNGFFDKVLDKLAHYILYLEILITLISGFFLIYFLFRDKNEA